jgi:hypothetical protein
MSAHHSSSLPLFRLALVGAVTPAIFALVDHWLVQRAMASSKSREAAELMVALVVQTGMLGILCGRFIEPAWLRWVIYGWGLILIDLNTMWLAGTWELSLLRTSLLAGQVGLITVWAVLGTTKWLIRWPVAIAAAGTLAAPTVVGQVYSHNAGSRFIVQTAALCLICGVLRSQGYAVRLRSESPTEAAAGDTATARFLQFSIRDVLFWMAALAVIFGIAQRSGSLTLTAGVLAGIVLVTALWAALGEGSAWLRWPVLAAVTAVAGIVFAVCEYYDRVSNASWSDVWVDATYFFTYHWVPLVWPPLVGSLLFASLLIFRTQGYRLSRKAKLGDSSASAA